MYRRETGFRGERTAPGDELDQDGGSRSHQRPGVKGTFESCIVNSGF